MQGKVKAHNPRRNHTKIKGLQEASMLAPSGRSLKRKAEKEDGLLRNKKPFHQLLTGN
tara:strand:- start:17 stop:190 length:174 start_codon:yes stop_codon:yes gene_type:complete